MVWASDAAHRVRRRDDGGDGDEYGPGDASLPVLVREVCSHDNGMGPMEASRSTCTNPGR